MRKTNDEFELDVYHTPFEGRCLYCWNQGVAAIFPNGDVVYICELHLEGAGFCWCCATYIEPDQRGETGLCSQCKW